MMLLCALLVVTFILLAFLACYVADRVDDACNDTIRSIDPPF